jgi:hypothetical protein
LHKEQLFFRQFYPRNLGETIQNQKPETLVF